MPPSQQVEYNDIVAAAEVANKYSMTQSWKALFSRKHSATSLVTASIAMLQQLTGERKKKNKDDALNGPGHRAWLRVSYHQPSPPPLPFLSSQESTR